MTKAECVDKANEAVALGVIQPDQYEAYLEYLIKKYCKNE